MLQKSGEVLIGTLSVSGKTKWDMLDNTIRRIFKVVKLTYVYPLMQVYCYVTNSVIICCVLNGEVCAQISESVSKGKL